MKTVYSVINKEGAIVYVGCTIDLKRREAQHRAYNPEVARVEILEYVEDSVANERELHWIYKFIDEGQPLKNRENKKNRTKKWGVHNDYASQKMCSVQILASTKKKIDKYAKEHGVYHYFVVHQALQEYIKFLKEIENATTIGA